MRALWSPWRYEYLAGEGGPEGCVFCRAAEAEDEEALILRRGEHNFVLLNLYPYTNGHLMIAPYEHAERPSAATSAVRAEMMELLAASLDALEAEYHPDGFNVGMNLGRAAGAGVADHYHLHALPRWEGDTNFMTSVAETRVLGQAIGDTWRALRKRFSGRAGEGS